MHLTILYDQRKIFKIAKLSELSVLSGQGYKYVQYID